MFYDIKRFILFKLKTVEYRIWVYRQNIEINRAFQLEARQPYYLAATTSFLLISFVVVSSIVIYNYNMKGNIAGYNRPRISIVEANLTTPPIFDVQNASPPPDTQERAILQMPFFEREEDNYTIAVDKARKELFVLSLNGKNFRIVEKFNILLGKNGGDKEKTGDMKTPEGVYKIIAVKEDDELLPMYGPRAFVLNYPNDTDKKQGKTGAGIWIHGMGDEDREPATKGCIAVDNTGLLKLSNYIKINTNVFIFPEGFMIPIDGEGVADILNEAFILELKNSMVASNT